MFTASTFALLSLPLLASAAPFLAKRDGSRFTYYDTSVGAGACGIQHGNSEYTVALNSAEWSESVCGKQIWISYGGKTVTASIQDECPSCGEGALDLSEGLFSALADKNLGEIYGSWGYGGSSSGSSSSASGGDDSSSAAPSSTGYSSSSSGGGRGSGNYDAQPMTQTSSAAPTSYAPTSASASASAPSASASSSPWSNVDATLACPSDQLLLWNATTLIYNGTYWAQNGSTSTFQNSTAEDVIATNDTQEICFNATLVPFQQGENATSIFQSAISQA